MYPGAWCLGTHREYLYSWTWQVPLGPGDWHYGYYRPVFDYWSWSWTCNYGY